MGLEGPDRLITPPGADMFGPDVESVRSSSPTNDRIVRWNERFSRREETHDFKPAPPLAAAIAGVSPGTALDIACGAGRHAIFLAERGWRVIAVDGSRIGIELMLAEAGARHCRDRIEAHVGDLESNPAEFAIKPDGYDLIADCYFLHRPLFPAIRSGVRPDGLFVAALHVPSPEGHHGHGFVLEPGELERMVSGWGWYILHAREGAPAESGHDHGTAELVARRPTVTVVRSTTSKPSSAA